MIRRILCLSLTICLMLPLTVSAAKLSTAQITANKAEIYSFLVNTLGCNMATACGIMANIEMESGFNPQANVMDTNDKMSYGLCQWNGDRNTSLKNYCTNKGLDYQTVAAQLQYLRFELQGDEAEAWAAMKGFPNTEQGAYDAAYTWAKRFERCDSSYFSKRAALAKVYFAEYSKNSAATLPTVPDVDMGGLEQNPATYTKGQFSDVKTQWFAQYVAVVVKKGLIAGNPNGTFNPYGNVTIAETVTMACRIYSRYHNDGEKFTRFGDAWYQTYFDYAYIHDIISKDIYTVSNPNGAATRAQFAQILYSALPTAALPAVNAVKSGAIPDVTVNAAYATAVYALYRAGVLTGEDDGSRSFMPASAIQRSQASAILARIADSSYRVAYLM